MQSLSIQELIYVFKIIAYFIGIIGIIIGIVSGVIAYIYKSDRKQNREEHRNLFKKTDDHGEEIARIFEKLIAIVKNQERILDLENIIREYAIRFDNMKEQHDENHRRKK